MWHLAVASPAPEQMRQRCAQFGWRCGSLWLRTVTTLRGSMSSHLMSHVPVNSPHGSRYTVAARAMLFYACPVPSCTLVDSTVAQNRRTSRARPAAAAIRPTERKRGVPRSPGCPGPQYASRHRSSGAAASAGSAVQRVSRRGVP